MTEFSLEHQIKYLIDALRPTMGPYEFVFYLFLFRHTAMEGRSKIRIGKRSIAEKLGKGSKGKQTNYQHVSEVLKKLEGLGLVQIGDTNREGTEYTVLIPTRSQNEETDGDPVKDYYRDPKLRKEIFARDGWVCAYCGEVCTPENATLDHFVPQTKGGSNTPDNLKAACLLCNSIKGGRSFEEAAPDLVISIASRKKVSQQTKRNDA